MSGGRKALERVERLLHQCIGLDVTTVGRSMVERAVRRRMEATCIGDPEAYVARLACDEPELQELVEAVVVPETYFFREPEALAQLALRIGAGGWPTAERPVRVLSAPCSTGEEPYSIVMTLLAAGVPAAALAVDAVDVSHEAVRRARLAEYGASSFRGGAIDWRPWFDGDGPRRSLRQSVRDVVRVEQGNLLDARFRPPRAEYDVIFCRNLLIYFDAETQGRVLGTLGALLAPDGTLVVGAADSFAVRAAGFVPVKGAERAFLFQRGGRPRADSVVRAATSPQRRRPLAGRPAAAPPRRVPRTGRQAVAIPPVAPTPPGEVIATMTRLADEGRLAETVRLGEAASEGAGATAALFTLLGTSHAALGDPSRAEQCYRRALYLDPRDMDSLLHLAFLLDARGAVEEASRLRTRARRALAGNAGGAA